MGGDGGTLNNTRHEHTGLRKTILQLPTDEERRAVLRQRASTTRCALTDVPLRDCCRVVCDRLGLMYDKEAVLRNLLRRAAAKRVVDGDDLKADGKGKGKGKGLCDIDADGRVHDPLMHVRSMKRDMIDVRASVGDDVDNGAFVCPVTKRAVLPTGRFSIGWRCGCIAADATPVATGGQTVGWKRKAGGLPEGERADGEAEPERECMVCGVVGPRVPLGLTVAERRRRLTHIAERGEGRKRKRKRRDSADVATEADVSKVVGA